MFDIEYIQLYVKLANQQIGQRILTINLYVHQNPYFKASRVTTKTTTMHTIVSM